MDNLPTRKQLQKISKINMDKKKNEETKRFFLKYNLFKIDILRIIREIPHNNYTGTEALIPNIPSESCIELLEFTKIFNEEKLTDITLNFNNCKIKLVWN